MGAYGPVPDQQLMTHGPQAQLIRFVFEMHNLYMDVRGRTDDDAAHGPRTTLNPGYFSCLRLIGCLIPRMLDL